MFSEESGKKTTWVISQKLVHKKVLYHSVEMGTHNRP